MDLLSFWTLVLLAAVLAMDVGCWAIEDQEVCANGTSNYTMIERKEENKTKNFTDICQETYTPDCSLFKKILSWFNNKCAERTRYVLITKMRTEVVVTASNVTKCCPGFDEKNKSCSEGCGSGTYGTNCDLNCSCPTGAFDNCDRDTGYCLCKPGLKGPNCSDECLDGRYGSNCTHSCTCQNNSTCDRATGTCNCSSVRGWTGSSCEEECDAGTYGEDCQHNCTCNGNQKCGRVTGNCTCMAGLTGPNCTEECTNYTYGIDCAKNCTCMDKNTESCNKTTGYCTCKAGYMGNACDEVCIPGFYGDACANNCSSICTGTNYCHHVSGTCICLGRKGENCSNECDAGTYGEDCQQNCTCNGNQTCDHVTGNCTCIAGLTGPNCTEECTNYTYGIDCAENCTCMGKYTESCNKQTGHCTCTAGYMGDTCDEVSTDTTHSDAMKPGWLDFVVVNWIYFAIGAGVFVFLVVVTIAVVCYCRLNRRKRSNKEKPEEEFPAAFANQENSNDTVDVLQDTVCETSGLEVSDHSKPNRNASEVDEHKAAAITGALSKESDSMSTDIHTEKPLTRTYEEPPDFVEPKHISDEVEYDSAEYLVETVREKPETTNTVNIEDEDDYDVHGNQTSITSDKLNEYNTFQDVIDIIRKASIADDASSDEYDMLNSQSTRAKSTHTTAEYSSFEITRHLSIDENDENSEDDEMYNKLETKQKVAKRIAHPNYNRVKINSELGSDNGVTDPTSKPRDASVKSKVLRESGKSKYNQDSNQGSEAGTTKSERDEGNEKKNNLFCVGSDKEKYDQENNCDDLYDECGPEDDDSKPAGQNKQTTRLSFQPKEPETALYEDCKDSDHDSDNNNANKSDDGEVVYEDVSDCSDTESTQLDEIGAMNKQKTNGGHSSDEKRAIKDNKAVQNPVTDAQIRSKPKRAHERRKEDYEVFELNT
ncbi:protein draper-like isoform X2 [Mya arenaria]|uniref:protein draper-like isoform X2 n=1 Tax=Mya arenaria TaxID=6604 RepID=UPI0022E25F74|nr:protein draper-like isoform X2 [Mya arenaria]